MKKLNKLFAIIIAVLGVQTLSAQTSWQTPANNQTYYLYNVDKGVFMNRGNDWGAQASGLDKGEAIKLVSSGAQYKLRSNNGNQGVFWEGDNVWMDGGGTTNDTRVYEWNLNKLSDGFYTLVPNGKSQSQALGMWADTPENTRLNTRFSATGTRHDDAPVRWAFITAAQYNAAQSNVAASISVRESLRPYILSARSMGFTSEETNAFYDINSTKATLQAALTTLPAKLLNYAKENGSESNPMDISFLIKNAYCVSMDSWTSNGDSWVTNNWNFQENGDACGWGVYLERWVSSSGSLADSELYQTLTGLPVGEYTLQVDACAALQNGSKSEVTGVQLYAEAYQPSSTTISTPEEKPKTWTTSFVTIDGQAKVGFKRESTTANWLMFDNFKLYYKGVTVEVLKISLDEAITKAKAIDQSTLSDGLKNLLNTSITDGESAKSSSDKTIVETATNNLISAMNAVVEVPAIMPELETCIADCENIYNNSTAKADIRDAFKAVIDDAKALVSSATVAATVTNAIAALQDARYTYIHTACPANDLTFDVSDVMTTSWANGGGNYTAAGVVMKERYSGQPYTGEVMSTIITGLTNGIYDVQIYCNANAAMHDGTWDFTDGAELTSVHANDISTKIPVKITKSNDYANVITLNDVTVKDHTLTIKIVNDENAANWVVVAHKSLIIKGALDLSEQQNSVRTLIEQANSIKNEVMGNAEKSDLVAAIDGADADSDNPDDLEAMITKLQNAISAANNSIDSFSKVSAYIAKATAIGVSCADYKDQYDNRALTDDVTTIFQNLEVATYNYVTEEFSYPVALSGDWKTEGPVGQLSTQHWSGENRPYMEQSSAAWGTSAWTIKYDQDLTLPAGEYVFKVAGRKASGNGCTLNLTVKNGDVVLGTVNDFPEGDTGLGINKNGVTSFDANDEAGFANNNAGRGWQWRYVKFTLASEATVNIAVNANATTNHQWISFCDATVQMTEKTYLAANMGALDAPTAAANALVDSKPMGTEQNQALKDALDLPVTTGAELLAKIEALNTAVANANAWIPKYNEAKAPLVAAMERFELRFNGEDGCVFAIGNEEWAELLDTVKYAALAKDVTDSYDIFEPAAAKLNAAMDKAEMYPTENKKSATATDMSNYYLVNPSFDEGNTNGWEFSGSQTNPVTRNVADGTFTATPKGSHYTGDAIWQKVTLAEGAYKLSANVNAGEVRGYSSQLFVAKSAPAWNNVLNDVVKTVTVTEFNKDVELTCVFSVEEKTEVYIGFNQKAGNVAGTDVYAPYTVYGFTLKQAVNQIHSENGVITVVGENEAEDVAGVQGDNNIVTVDLTGATWAEGSTLTLVNKNALVYVADGANINAGNVVKNGVSESIVLTDGYNFNAREGFTADAVSYNRTFAQGTWLSVCVPFDFTIPEGVKVETLGEVDVDGKVFTFNEVTDKMEANKPYIIKNSTENAALFAALESVDVKATPADMTTAVEGAEFGSTYRTVTSTELMEEGAYDILFFGTDGQLYYLTEGSKAITFKPFRSYIRVERGRIDWSDGVAARVRHSSDDFTGIDEVETDEEGEVVIYDLMGRRVTSMQKGSIYIINGKKVLNK